MRAAWRLAKALGCNIVPTTVEGRVPLFDGWGCFAYPGCVRIDTATMTQWRDLERAQLQPDPQRALAANGDRIAWALLPGSGRIVVLGGDSEEWTNRLLERQPTPLVVRSPTPGRAHLYYRWPEGVDIGPKTNVAGKDTYDMKGRGSTIHCPGSLHKSRRGRYVCDLPISEQVIGLRERLPTLDLAAVEEDARAAGKGPTERPDWDFDRWSIGGEGERRWQAYLKSTPPQTRGGRQSKLWALACRAGDLGLPEPAARPGLLAWAAECVPPLPEAEVVDVLLRAYRTRKTAIGCELSRIVEPLTIDL